MLYHISIHTPKPEHIDDVLASMHRFGNATRTQAGLREVHTLRDRRSATLVGLAVWDSIAHLTAARPALGAATEGDDFDAWEDAPIRSLLLEEA